MKGVKKLIIAVLIIIIILIIAIVIILLGRKNIDNNNEIYGEAEESIEINKNLDLVKNQNMYFSIVNAIASYYGYLSENEISKVYNILDEQYIEKENITQENVLKKLKNFTSEFPTFNAEEMYVIDDAIRPIYYIYGTFKSNLDNKTSDKVYFQVNIDYSNTAFSLSKLKKEEYEKIIQNKEKPEVKEIKQNDSNKFYILNVNDETICNNLIINYKEKINSNIEESYKLLNTEYRQKKFDNINEYKSYLENREIEYSMLSNYTKKENEDSTRYICIDQNKNYYIFEMSYIMKYNLILDTYTIDLPEFVEQYNTVSDPQKVQMNIQRFFDAINDGDYKYAYNKLDSTYKQNKFPTQNDFETYMKKTFFKKNKLGYKSYQKSGDLYIYDMVISDRNDSTKTINKNFVVKLLEGTDFVMSFSAE